MLKYNVFRAKIQKIDDDMAECAVTREDARTKIDAWKPSFSKTDMINFGVMCRCDERLAQLKNMKEYLIKINDFLVPRRNGNGNEKC